MPCSHPGRSARPEKAAVGIYSQGPAQEGEISSQLPVDELVSIRPGSGVLAFRTLFSTAPAPPRPLSRQDGVAEAAEEAGRLRHGLRPQEGEAEAEGLGGAAPGHRTLSGPRSPFLQVWLDPNEVNEISMANSSELRRQGQPCGGGQQNSEQRLWGPHTAAQPPQMAYAA
jgi:hypothetical protein